MNNISISGGIDVGGFHYEVDMSKEKHVHYWKLKPVENHICIGVCDCGEQKEFPFTFIDALEYAFRHCHKKENRKCKRSEIEKSAYMANFGDIQMAKKKTRTKIWR